MVVLQTAQQQRASLPKDPKELALALADLLDRKKGEDIVLLDISGPLVITDFFVIATAKGTPHQLSPLQLGRPCGNDLGDQRLESQIGSLETW